VSKQRLPLTPLKSASNKTKSRNDGSDDEESSTDNDQDEDYNDKYIKSRLKKESESSKSQTRHINTSEDNYDDKSVSPNYSTLKIPLEGTKSSEEVDFLVRLNTFMAERSSAYPKLIWGLRDG
jgi:hypothetical protein